MHESLGLSYDCGLADIISNRKCPAHSSDDFNIIMIKLDYNIIPLVIRLLEAHIFEKLLLCAFYPRLTILNS